MARRRHGPPVASWRLVCLGKAALIGTIGMSTLGQKQTCAVQLEMSALPPKADMCGATADVRYGPIADMSDAISARIFSSSK